MGAHQDPCEIGVLVNKGRACITCHEDDWENLSKKTVAGSALEPSPIAGKNPLIKLGVKAAQACWVTFHNGMRGTKGMATKAEVKAHPVLGKDGLKKSDVRKFLLSSRTDSAVAWNKAKSKEKIAAIKAAGGFLDLWQWRAARSNPVGMADDGYVLEYRLFDKGKNPFSWNMNRKTMTP